MDTWLVRSASRKTLLNQARGPVWMHPFPCATRCNPASRRIREVECARGLPFARWDSGRGFFGINDAREDALPASRPPEDLSNDLEASRHRLSAIRAMRSTASSPERWLEPSSRMTLDAHRGMTRSAIVYAHTSKFCELQARILVACSADSLQSGEIARYG